MHLSHICPLFTVPASLSPEKLIPFLVGSFLVDQQHYDSFFWLSFGSVRLASDFALRDFARFNFQNPTYPKQCLSCLSQVAVQPQTPTHTLPLPPHPTSHTCIRIRIRIRICVCICICIRICICTFIRIHVHVPSEQFLFPFSVACAVTPDLVRGKQSPQPRAAWESGKKKKTQTGRTENAKTTQQQQPKANQPTENPGDHTHPNSNSNSNSNVTE